MGKKGVTRRHVLLVDDNETDVMLAQAAFELSGLDAQVSVEGADALAFLRRDPRLRHLPVVMLTTSGADGDVYGSDARGANADVVKPVSFDGMVEAIRTLTAFWVTLNSTVHAQEHLAREETLPGVHRLNVREQERALELRRPGPLLS